MGKSEGEVGCVVLGDFTWHHAGGVIMWKGREREVGRVPCNLRVSDT